MARTKKDPATKTAEEKQFDLHCWFIQNESNCTLNEAKVAAWLAGPSDLTTRMVAAGFTAPENPVIGQAPEPSKPAK